MRLRFTHLTPRFRFWNKAAVALAIGLAPVMPTVWAKGRTLYVSPAGNDAAPGSEKFPWRTIQKACDEMQPGDTTIVRAGIYNEQLFVEVEGNATDGPVTLQAEGKAVITAQGLDEDNVIYIENKSHIRIIGFEIRDLHTEDGSGIRFEGAGSHLEFRDNHIHSIRGKNAMGITIYGTDADNPVSRVTIDGNEIHDCDAAPSEALTLNGNVTDFEVTNNHVHDIVGVGIDFIGGEDGIVDDRTKAARNGVCRGNRVERVRANYGGGYGPGIYVDGGRDIVVEGNQVSECDLGIEVGAENPGVVVSGVVVTGNVIAGNDKAGLVVGGYEKKRGRVRECRFENNLIRDNTSHAKAEAEIWIQWAEANDFRNNLIVGREGSEKPLLYSENPNQENAFDFNLWHLPGGEPTFVWSGREYAGFEAFREGTGLDRRGNRVDPKLAADGIHLGPGSPAIDAGDPETKIAPEAKDIDGEPRVKGGRIDVGPDEG
ncbi:MAG: right-handed parallel beta-helix repeat-containing protein [Verrucomicrobiales bacterium]|nr:right-handed parallel beta-helix repeat-containing protein [Verrucomicrobiales bacterium]